MGNGFIDPARRNHVCCLHKALYEIKHAPRVCFYRFATYIISMGVSWHQRWHISYCLYSRGSKLDCLLLYVDDIILTASSSSLLTSLAAPQWEFDMKDLGSLRYFLAFSLLAHRQVSFLTPAEPSRNF